MPQSSNHASLSHIKGWIIDMDGVLYRDTEPIPGAGELLATFTREGTPFLLLTNNSALTPGQYARKIGQMGMDVPEQQILTSALATAAYLDENAPAGSPVYCIGSDGLIQALQASHVRLTEDWREARYVTVGHNRKLMYQHLQDAALAIRNGAQFIGTNPDRTLPTPIGEIPGNGAILAALEAATDTEPLIIGKPQPGIFDWARSLMGLAAHEVACLGDRLETDILGGDRAGLFTVFVLSGVSTEDDLARFTPKPDAVFRGPFELLDAWKAR